MPLLSRSRCCSADTPAIAPPILPPLSDLNGEKMVLQITKMCCPVEADLIRKSLVGMNGILQLDFDLIRRELVIMHRGISRVDVISALRAVDMEPDQTDTIETSGMDQARSIMAKPIVSRRDWMVTVIAGFTAIGAEIFVWAGVDEHSWWIIGLALISILVGGLGTLKRGWIALRHLSLNINFLMSLAVLGAMAIGQWPEAAMVIFLFGVAERVEAFSLDKARNAVRELMALAPEAATIQTDTGEWETVTASTVSVGQVARIKPGERIALDGVVISGRSGVNQAPITGESVPIMKETGHALYAGSINGAGVLEYRVTADFRHSTLARIIDTVLRSPG